MKKVNMIQNKSPLKTALKVKYKINLILSKTLTQIIMEKFKTSDI